MLQLFEVSSRTLSEIGWSRSLLGVKFGASSCSFDKFCCFAAQAPDAVPLMLSLSQCGHGTLDEAFASSSKFPVFWRWFEYCVQQEVAEALP